jgi:hypothetical protein
VRAAAKKIHVLDSAVLRLRAGDGGFIGPCEAAVCRTAGSPGVNPTPEDLRQGQATFESTCSTRQGLRSNPITFALDGKQYVFVTAGIDYMTITLP